MNTAPRLRGSTPDHRARARRRGVVAEGLEMAFLPLETRLPLRRDALAVREMNLHGRGGQLRRRERPPWERQSQLQTLEIRPWELETRPLERRDAPLTLEIRRQTLRRPLLARRSGENRPFAYETALLGRHQPGHRPAVYLGRPKSPVGRPFLHP